MSARHELVLAVDTSGPAAGVVLADRERVDVALLPLDEGGRARTEDLAACTATLLAARGCAADRLSAVGAVVGPGSYTGLRSGLAFLRGLTFADAIPAVAVGSLELLAWSCCAEAESVVATRCMSPGRAVLAAYARHGELLTELAAPGVFDVDDLDRYLQEQAAGCCALVTASWPTDDANAARVSAAASRAGLDVRRKSGDSLADLAALVAAKARHAATTTAAALLPVYIGWSSVKPNRDRVALRDVSE